MIKNFPRILVCPLDWGIGHATRCVPIIKYLLQNNFEVLIAADGKPLDFLRTYFPEQEIIRFPGFRVTYPSGNKMVLKMLLRSPVILLNIYKEHRRLKKIIREKQVDIVISDNRFGLWSDKTFSIYISHQILIKTPEKMKWAESMLYNIHGWFIKHYDECWVPDLPGERNLSGDLSHQYPLPGNGHYIGLLSRFEESAKMVMPDEQIDGPDVLFMLSGPEPQRSILENVILSEIQRQHPLKAVILQGLPGKIREHSPFPGVNVYNHLPDKEIKRLISHAGIIICRPGYSTIMDLAALGRNAVIVPTPGQTEQEYLADYLSAGGLFHKMSQEGFDLQAALQAGKGLPASATVRNNTFLLERRINGLREKVKIS